MLAIVYTACSILTGACETHRIPTTANELQCLATAQSEVAQRVRSGFTVMRYGCERG